MGLTMASARLLQPVSNFFIEPARWPTAGSPRRRRLSKAEGAVSDTNAPCGYLTGRFRGQP